MAFHAEGLDDARTWQRTRTIAQWLCRRGGRATFFVYPFRATVKNRSIEERVAHLASLGHEIAQHTHFYSGFRIDPPDKIDDLSAANVEFCIRRDRQALRRMGSEPKGFVAGAWYVNAEILDCLIRLGFEYDCSTRVSVPGRVTSNPLHSWRDGPYEHASSAGRLRCLPTTCSVGEWFKDRRWLRRSRPSGSIEIVYVHDYDLVLPRYWILMRLFLAFQRIVSARLVPVEMIASEV